MDNLNLNSTIGALEGGIIVTNLLFGTFTMQVHIYYRKFPHDYWPLKTLVAVIWLLELAHTLCIMHGLFVMTISHHSQIIGIPKSLMASFIFSGIVGPIVQAFFVTRVARCFDKPYLAILCWTLTSFHVLTNVLMIVGSFTSQTVALFEARWQWVVMASLITEACVDLLTATSLCYFLVKSRRHSVHKRTTRLLDRLIAMTIPTGLITSLMAISNVICFLTMPDNLVWMALMICQAKLFSNSMLASLNSRLMFRHDQERDTTVPLSNFSIFDHNSVELTTRINLGSFLTSEVSDAESASNPMAFT